MFTGDLTGIVALLVIFLSPVAIIKIISDNRLRNKLIDKGMVNEQVKYLYSGKSIIEPFSSVKWGLVLIGIGGALLIGNLAYLHEEIILGLMFILAGVGFLVYYFWATLALKKTERPAAQNRVE